MITIQTTINAPIEKIWEYWITPEHIVGWAFASDDWESPGAENDFRVDGRFKTQMAAKDKSAAFDFTGVYTAIDEHKIIDYTIDDGRKVHTVFEQTEDGVQVTQMFEPEGVYPKEKQQEGWQAILDNFKRYVEAN